MRKIELTTEQQRGCRHAAKVHAEIATAAIGCEDCLKTGDVWVHLRICMECGGVRCCDDSPNRHATKHYKSTSHPVIRSFERGEEWAWCFPDELAL